MWLQCTSRWYKYLCRDTIMPLWQSDQPVTPLSDLLKDDASKEDNITVCAKVVKVSDPKNAVTQQSRGNKVSEVTLLDTTGTMTLDLWNEQIAQVQIDCVYRFTSLSTSYWNDSKKLSSTINTAIKQSFQPDLCSLQFKESDDTGLQNKHTIIAQWSAQLKKFKGTNRVVVVKSALFN